ncbi:methionine synthase vitamin-B12 independent [Leucosporidium creatinivorum]|uniref:Methionine synthase vitamin-B12 independent n=1 Tax=Leucosporidium creatinivorum TaxID=106004 RepID=A0A1Y2EDE9_9BASI|nr:methionine synthase vitamin-B12 independent [Leucosporidium creatinivorum]
MAPTEHPILHKPEHVGSFLRPQSVHEARAAHAQGKLDDTGLRKVEDAAIQELVKQQEAAGLRSVSDGEFRREYFHLDFLKHLGGVTVTKNKLVGEKDEAAPPQLTVTGKLVHKKPIQVEDFQFVKSCLSHGDSVVKVAIPSPTMIHFRGGRAAIDISSYPDMDQFFEDLAAVYRAEIAALAETGVTYIQLDDTNLAYLCSDEMRAAAESRGEDVQQLPKQYVELINAALRDKPASMTAAIHLCRGNFRSRFFSSGGYEPVAEVLLRDLNVDMFLLEYDDERSGGFEPLQHLPKGHKTVTLGLISTKTGKLEDKQEVIARIREAAKFAPLEQLSVGPQCGFASTVHGNELTQEEQWAKIKLCQDIVEEVWGKQ